MNRESAGRMLALVVCLGLLAALFVLGGAHYPMAPEDDIGPKLDALEADYDAHVDRHIQSSGVVQDDGRLHVEPHKSDLVVTLEDSEGQPIDLEPGEEVTFYGQIAPDRTIVVDRDHVATRMPWERYYMYAISVLGVILTAAVGLNYWRMDRRRLVLEPRDEPIVPLLADREGDRDG